MNDNNDDSDNHNNDNNNEDNLWAIPEFVQILYFSFICLPLLVIGYYFYQISTKLKFEDNFFISAEMNYYFWAMICGLIFFCVMSIIDILVASTGINYVAVRIILTITLTVEIINYYLYWFLSTYWLLNKLKVLLNDKSYNYSNHKKYNNNNNHRKRKSSDIEYGLNRKESTQAIIPKIIEL